MKFHSAIFLLTSVAPVASFVNLKNTGGYRDSNFFKPGRQIMNLELPSKFPPLQKPGHTNIMENRNHMGGHCVINMS
jgi:hypothetical protein